MKNLIQKMPSEFSEHLSSLKVKTALFTSAESGQFLYLSGEWSDHKEKREQYPNAKVLSGLLGSSGSSWSEKAYAFYVADCFDPCVYIQFGASWEDAYESYCDNDEGLVIPEKDLPDYGLTKGEDGTYTDSDYSGQWTSEGKAIDFESVQTASNQSLKLVEITF